jgi:hypothetical protein
MSIVRKHPIARAEHIDDAGIAWIAEARAGTGTWVIREEQEDPAALRGRFFEFSDEDGDLTLRATAEERTALGMSDDTYQRLNVVLQLDYERRQRERSERR